MASPRPCQLFAFLFAVVVFCCPVPAQGREDDSTRSAAVIADLNGWWKKETYAPTPEKPGTVTPGRTITIKGRTRTIPKHVQTKAEYDEQVKDAKWQEHRRTVVLGFQVAGDTLTVVTNLSRNSIYLDNPIDKRDAQELCHDFGAFVWSKEYRHWGLNSIRVIGPSHELLSSRIGLSGKVQ